MRQQRSAFNLRIDSIVDHSAIFLHPDTSKAEAVEEYAFWYDRVEAEIAEYLRIVGIVVDTKRNCGQKPERFSVALLNSLTKGRSAFADNLRRQDIVTFLHSARRFRDSFVSNGGRPGLPMPARDLLNLQVRKVHVAMREFIQPGVHNDLVALFESIRDKERHLELWEASLASREPERVAKERQLGAHNAHNLASPPWESKQGASTHLLSSKEMVPVASNGIPLGKSDAAGAYGSSKRSFAKALVEIRGNRNGRPTGKVHPVDKKTPAGTFLEKVEPQSNVTISGGSQERMRQEDSQKALLHLIDWLLADRAKMEAAQDAAIQELEALRASNQSLQDLLEKCLVTRAQDKNTSTHEPSSLAQVGTGKV